ncbi:hypothetical protein VKT23_017034 [Stygiomarasmius scandens]|uniref:Uncharacterized protein n=1 Tax=Marasmiellus scandens TaxID=2682957 RepID=A0ABR1ITB2_9AGAR
MPASPTDEPTQEQLDNLALKAKAAFGYRPCIPQLLSVWHQLQGKNVFTIARNWIWEDPHILVALARET